MNIELLTPPEFRKNPASGGTTHSNVPVSSILAQKPDRFQPLFVGSDTDDERKKRKRRESTISSSSTGQRIGLSTSKRQGYTPYSGLPGTPTQRIPRRCMHIIGGKTHKFRVAACR